MNIILKVVLGIVAVAAVLFVALIVAVTVIIEPNDYRPYIVDAVEDATGRPFTLAGDLGLELMPCCGVSLGAARLASPPGFPEEAFASVEEASLSVKLWPLLVRRQVEIGTVTIDGLELNLVRAADGAVNWDLEAGSAADTDEPSDASPIGLSVEGVVLRNGRVHYRDLETGDSYRVSDLALESGLAMAGERLTVSAPTLHLLLTGSMLPEPVSADVSAQTLIADLGDTAAVSLEAVDVQVAAAGARLQITGGGRVGDELDLSGDFALLETSPRELLAAFGGDEPLYRPAGTSALESLSAEGRWQVSTASAGITGLTVRLDDTTLTGSVAVDDFETLATRFDVAVDALDADAYLPADDEDAAAAPAGTAGEPTEIPLDRLAEMPVNGSLRIGRLSASGVALRDVAFGITTRDDTVSTSLAAQGLDGSIEIVGTGEVGGEAPAIGGTLTIDGVSPRALLTALEAAHETADPEVLARFGGSAQWRLQPRRAVLQAMRWQLDDTTLTGSAQVEDFTTLATRFDLALDRMNLDRYLAPDSAAAEADEAEAELIPVEAIRGLDLNGRLRAGELTVMRLALEDVVAQVAAADGVLRLDPLTAALYGGRYQGVVVVDATGADARLTLDQELAAVQVQDLLGSFLDTDVLAGALSFELAGSGSGNTATELLRGLAADVSFDLSDGVYRGTNVLYQLQRARALLGNEEPPAPPERNETPIRTLTAQGRMIDGVLQTRQLSARTDALRLLGEGGIDLTELVLDYELSAQVLENAATAAKLGDLAGLSIPLTLEGPLTAPKVGVDLQGLLTGAVRGRVQEKAREALLKRLRGDDAEDEDAAADPGGAAAAPEDAAPEEEPAPPRPRDLLKRGLLDLLEGRQQEEPEEDADGDAG